MPEGSSTDVQTVPGDPSGKSIPAARIEQRDISVIRFAGDSGDGIQLIGDLFTATATALGENVATLPDYPPEIRAPAGTTAGVSGFQICFGSADVFTPGDKADVLVALNPAALAVNLDVAKKGGIVLINEDSFTPKDLEKAGCKADLLQSPELAGSTVVPVKMVSAMQKELAGSGLGVKQIDRCKNFFALGLCFSLFSRSPETALSWIKAKFGSKPEILNANLKALACGIAIGEDSSVFPLRFSLRKVHAVRKAGVYRQISGNTAAALGLIAASMRCRRRLFLGSYPITPATDILQTLSSYPHQAVVFQAEDEIAAIGAAVGASYGGALAATSTSGPGFSLKSEFMNLAVIAELPLVIINVQRAGPSTGIPTKTEQADLLQALYGRHGESPLPVLAAASSADCFDIVIEASRIALKYMTPVVVLTDGYLANGSEIWRVPAEEELPDLSVAAPVPTEKFLPYSRDNGTLARPWAVPGMPGFEHRLGGLEKLDGSGSPSHSAENHQKMVLLRAEKIRRISADIPDVEVYGDKQAKLLILGWGSTYGVIREAVDAMRREGLLVACANLRHLNPLPKNLGPLLSQYQQVLMPENNLGQLCHELRAEFLLDLKKLSKVKGLPFTPDEIISKAKTMLGEKLQ